ncbi:MAG: 30S ribosomal protein S12 methylthiotransferase RimO [Gammaproteobacteria bacterium]|nr:30S ribosomal protein S12 methylthiotransferase RimO [Gammaproteobacteria bacterium]MDH5776884.1 30S ribosomal protein S12 methylthiotransferase RimO [Gammaproteobacteria bacterium]
MSHKIGFISLGCPKATVDSERILTQLRAEGYEFVNQYADAGLVIVNTCGFIDDAVAESLETIGEALQENGKVIVTGCLGARGDLVQQAHPSVLAVTGPHALDEVMEAVHQHLPAEHDPYTSLIPPGGIKLTPRHYAYLKIAEGCNHRCTFCIIPALRGDLDSRPVGEVMKEAEALVTAGVRELLVVSQDTSAYGVDVKYKTDLLGGRPLKTRFKELAAALGELDAWIRLHYVYPYPHVDEVIPLMAEGYVLPYLDVPLQHASRRILKAMKRPADSENVLRRLESWRSVCPDITLRSTFIVGFPGETEQDFDELLSFIKAAQLDRVGAFTYSPVEGAKANELPNPISEAEKQDRLEEFMQLQAGISANKLAAKVGQTLTVIVDGEDEHGLIARSQADAPEIDGVVYIEGETGLSAGEFVDVKIINSDEHDLYGNLVE